LSFTHSSQSPAAIERLQQALQTLQQCDGSQ
jgi:hypothetical protein